jgi:RNA polymerase sigma-70 factor, ECF subfamily
MTRTAEFESSDDNLVNRISLGDLTAVDELFRRHRSIAYRVAYRLLGHEADALDAVQDGFVNAIRNLDRFARRSSFKTWLLRIVSNAALDLGRVRNRRVGRYVADGHEAFLELTDARADSADHRLEQSDLRQILDQALAELPEPQRQAFVLHADGGLSYQEVADALGIAIGTVMSRLFYARQRLKTSLAQHVSP